MVKFFSKNLRGQEGQSPRKNSVFFLRSFFFCASCVKRKSERMTFDVVMTQRTMFTLIYFIRHPERSEAESNFFRLRSQTSLRSVCSSLRSEFDYAQDDVDEKSAEQSKAGSTNNLRTIIILFVIKKSKGYQNGKNKFF